MATQPINEQAVLDKPPLPERKEQLTLGAAEELAHRLAATVRGSSYAPDLVLGIANGGVHPAHHVAADLGLPLMIISVKRRTTALKQRLSGLRRVLGVKWLRRPVYLVNRQVDRWFGGVAENSVALNGEVAGKNVLIVDDCVDSGASAAFVVSKLRERGAADIRLATLCWTTKYDSAAMHGVVPDYHLSRVLHSFPWSADNADYATFGAWLRSFNEKSTS